MSSRLIDCLAFTLIAWLSTMMVRCDAQEVTRVASSPNALREGLRLAANHNHHGAIEAFTTVIESGDASPSAYYLRGRELFLTGEVNKSLADFDRYIELQPNAAARQWERGIACYYAGEFQKGVEQFDLYQTYHDQDVENAVWGFLCAARAENVDKARKKLLPIARDTRVPMMAIYELYRGKQSVEQVFEAVRAGEPTAAELKSRLFYANLYVGLYLEALGDEAKARPYIEAAAKEPIGHYMGDVARIHAKLLAEKRKQD